MLIGVYSLLTSMQVLGSQPVSCALSAIRPDDPSNRGVAFSMERVPVLCSEVCVHGDSGGGVEQKEDLGCETPRSVMERDDEYYV